jgi:hypothetical protein
VVMSTSGEPLRNHSPRRSCETGASLAGYRGISCTGADVVVLVLLVVFVAPTVTID